MANNRFNMQVTPKGYKAGGKVSPTKKAGPKAARSPSKQQRKMGASPGAMAKKKNKDLTSNITGKKLTNKTAIDKINKTKAKYSALKESANSNNPMRTDRVFRTGSVNYRRPEDAIEFYGNKGRREGLAEKAMNRRIEVLKNNMATGGRIKKMGGGMMQRPMYKKGSEVKSMYKPYNRKDLLEGAEKAKERNKKQDARKKEINEAAKKFKVGGGGKYKYGPHKVDVNRRATESLLGRGKIQEKIIKFADKFDKKQEEKRKNKKAMGGRIRKMGGGSLKAVPAGNKGLKKLPTEVRNKMGFMKKGGVVSDTKKKQFKANQAGQKATNKKAMKVAKGVLNVAFPAVGASEIGKKITRKFKGDK